ncbi:MAG: hypothetical protein F4137_12240 [Acidobacteria bacterium]|nr:hypothetical protein [Acidobacteriota bacterium]
MELGAFATLETFWRGAPASASRRNGKGKPEHAQTAGTARRVVVERAQVAILENCGKRDGAGDDSRGAAPVNVGGFEVIDPVRLLSFGG